MAVGEACELPSASVSAPHYLSAFWRGGAHSSAARASAQTRVTCSWPPILPYCGEGERLGEQHRAELAAIHLDPGPRIEGAAEALLDGLSADATNPRRDLLRVQPSPPRKAVAGALARAALATCAVQEAPAPAVCSRRMLLLHPFRHLGPLLPERGIETAQRSRLDHLRWVPDLPAHHATQGQRE
jgi:hypothetical protein